MHGHEGEAGLGGAARAHWHFGPFPGSMGSAVRKKMDCWKIESRGLVVVAPVGRETKFTSIWTTLPSVGRAQRRDVERLVDRRGQVRVEAPEAEVRGRGVHLGDRVHERLRRRRGGPVHRQARARPGVGARPGLLLDGAVLHVEAALLRRRVLVAEIAVEGEVGRRGAGGHRRDRSRQAHLRAQFGADDVHGQAPALGGVDAVLGPFAKRACWRRGPCTRRGSRSRR